MTNRRTAAILVACLATLSLACGSSDDDSNTEMTATWKFESGDCASNAVDKVRVTVTHAGTTAATKEFACSAGTGDLLKISTGSYGVLAEGLNASGKVVFTSSQTATFPDGKIIGTLDMTLRAAPSKVTVTWKGCPPSVILPYQVTLYRGATADKTKQAAQTSASCSASQAVLEGIAPGEYTAEVDSRAVTPNVKGTAPVTVKAGEDTEVNIPVP
jgi:hypothetical protein